MSSNVILQFYIFVYFNSHVQVNKLAETNTTNCYSLTVISGRAEDRIWYRAVGSTGCHCTNRRYVERLLEQLQISVLTHFKKLIKTEVQRKASISQVDNYVQSFESKALSRRRGPVNDSPPYEVSFVIDEQSKQWP